MSFKALTNKLYSNLQKTSCYFNILGLRPNNRTVIWYPKWMVGSKESKISLKLIWGGLLENLLEYYRKTNRATKKKLLGCIFSEKLIWEKGKVATPFFTEPIRKNQELVSEREQGNRARVFVRLVSLSLL